MQTANSQIVGNQKRKHALAFVCTWSLRWEVLVIFLPKICYVALNLSQTYLIQAVVLYTAESDQNDWNNGYGLIAAFALVYVGLAVSLIPILVYHHIY
jgi:ATP-binding cassette, subfamily C (CFTR/MRP), member 1